MLEVMALYSSEGVLLKYRSAASGLSVLSSRLRFRDVSAEKAELVIGNGDGC